MNPQIIEQLESMSEDELQALLETEFPEEMEKEAAAELVESELTDALYAYGALSAERALAEIEGEGDLSKVASAEEIEAHESAESEVAQLIEAAMQELGLADQEDEIELHKTAQACAAVIFEGYSDALEKIAGSQGKSKGVVESVKRLAKTVSKKVKSAVSGGSKAGKGKGKGDKTYLGRAKAHVMKHSGKYGLGAGALVGGAAGYGASSAMDKKASDMTVGEIMDTIAGISEIDAGIQKLAGKGTAKASRLKQVMDHVKKHSGKYGLGAGAVGGATAGVAAHQMQKRRG